MKHLLAGTGLAAAAAVVAFAGVSAAAGSDEPSKVDKTPRIATLPVTERLSPSALAEIGRRHGSFRPLVSAPAAAISRATALKTAGAQFRFVNDAKTVNSQIGTFTDGSYGAESQPDKSKASVLKPRIKDRLVWLVEVKGFTMPEMGPMLPDGTTPESDPVTGGSDGLFVVDAMTGELISGDQYSAFPADNEGD